MTNSNKNNDEIILPDGYRERKYRGMRYGLFIPPSYNPSKSYPIIISLHGSSDTTSWNLVWYNEPIVSEDPCIVFTPKSHVIKNGWGTSWSPNHSEDMVKSLEIIEKLKGELNIDLTRIYIIGASMGGFGVLNLLAKEPEMFAAGIAICGGGDASKAPDVMKTPLWIFHGSDDSTVPVENSRNIYSSILESGGTKVRYTEYPGVGHDSWVPAWKEPTIKQWILSQKKGVEGTLPKPIEKLSYKILADGRIQLEWVHSANEINTGSKNWYYKIFRNSELISELDKFSNSIILEDCIGHTRYSIIAVNYYFKCSKEIFIDVDSSTQLLS